LIEWISDRPGLRVTTLSLKCAVGFLNQPGALAVVDPRAQFHPASAGHLGVPLSRLMVVRPAEYSVADQSKPQQHDGIQTPFDLSHRQRADALWAVEQLARCAGVRIVLTWIDRISSTAQRRLQLAVENSGVTVFLIRPPQALRQTSWADLRLHVQSAVNDPQHASGVVRTKVPAQTRQTAGGVSGESACGIVVRLLRSKNSVQHQGKALLRCNDETGDVFEIPELADSAAAATAVG
jgi:hypothetical protein